LNRRHAIVVVANLCLAASIGCGQKGAPNVSPAAAAARALELYDANHNAALDPDELAACPPLDAAAADFDANGDGVLTADEISERLMRMFDAGSGLSEATCTVTLDGRPLAGGKVLLRPAAMFEGSLHPAEGIADDSGLARMSIANNLLPAEDQAVPLAQFGLYHVEITHPDRELPARYNVATELAWKIDPLARGGSSAEFRLKSK
jgi:hypothetical protein